MQQGAVVVVVVDPNATAASAHSSRQYLLFALLAVFLAMPFLVFVWKTQGLREAFFRMRCWRWRWVRCVHRKCFGLPQPMFAATLEQGRAPSAPPYRLMGRHHAMACAVATRRDPLSQPRQPPLGLDAWRYQSYHMTTPHAMQTMRVQTKLQAIQLPATDATVITEAASLHDGKEQDAVCESA